jgi:RND superfamily putative drug exporter
VATVLGPREEELAQSLIGPALEGNSNVGLSLAKSGNAARYLLILDEDPLGGRTVDDLRALRDRMGSLVQQAGLTGVTVSLSGDSALATDTVDATLRDLKRIAVVALAVQLLLLIVFLRSLIAPLYLLATSVLALLASLGLATLAFQRLFHFGYVTYYVPFATAVLLVSLGSDYNIFIVGRMWEEARGRPLREAITVGARRATRPITIAGLTMAATFALLALVPIRPFREFAFTMTVGVLLDSFVVRSFLVPALVSLFGRASFWPGRIPQTAERSLDEQRSAA